MAKKRPAPKKSVKAAKPGKPVKSAAKSAAKQPTSGTAVVCFTLRDSGASSLRFHSEHQERDRARGIAMSLSNSPDVAEAFVFSNVEVLRRASLG